MKKTTTTLTLILAIVVAIGISGLFNDAYNAFARKIIFNRNVVLNRNVSIRSGAIDQWNGSLSTTTGYYTQATGGVDDYNAGGSIPADSFTENFTQCTSANNYCSTGDATVCAGDVCWQDNHTNLVWSDYLNGGAVTNWFVANSCQYPNGLPLDDTVCDTHGEDACVCVKQTAGNETGCEAIGDGNWRLPYQKELMQAYIDGSYGSGMPHASFNFWSATTRSTATHNAWRTYLNIGYTTNIAKTSTTDSRCVRR